MCFLICAMSAYAQKTVTDKNEQCRQDVRNILQLDYTLPDYSTNRIDAKVIGLRLAKILTQLSDTYQQYMNLSALSVMQSNQIEGLSYGRVKKIKLDKVKKQGNEITIRYVTTLENNNLNMKKSKLVLKFANGVSDDVATNDFFSNLCRYMKE